MVLRNAIHCLTDMKVSINRHMRRHREQDPAGQSRRYHILFISHWGQLVVFYLSIHSISQHIRMKHHDEEVINSKETLVYLEVIEPETIDNTSREVT